MMRIASFTGQATALLFGVALAAPGSAQSIAPPGGEILFTNVRIYNGSTPTLSAPTNVLVRGNVIAAIGPAAKAKPGATTIAGRGRTLMPGLIDAHVHMTYSMWSQADMLSDSVTAADLEARAAKGADEMLMRGFTAVRDLGGPIFSLSQDVLASTLAM